jgi:hypothetical protein
MLKMIDGIGTRLEPSAPARIRGRMAVLRQRIQQATTRVEEKRVERSIEALIERESAVTAAAQSYQTSLLPEGLQSTLEKQILLKKMLGQITPKRLTKRWSQRALCKKTSASLPPHPRVAYLFLVRCMPRDEAAGCGTAFAFGIAGAVIIGFPSFLAGFIGPIIFTPQANQGPLLGIFITGPAGAVIGFIAGTLFSQRHRKKQWDNTTCAATQTI